jgi:hypothetical protein
MSETFTSPVVLDLPGPWTEERYFALGHPPERIELVHGNLWADAPANRPDLALSLSLLIAMSLAAQSAGLRIHRKLTVRLSPDTTTVADIVVSSAPVVTEVTEAADVILVADMPAPVDREPHMRRYAAAGIGWYLLVEPSTPGYESAGLRLFRLDEDRYVEAAVAGHGEILRSDHPYPFEVDTTRLIGPFRT